MKILLLSAAMDCGGAETHVFTLAKQLYRRGHQITVASSGGALAERLESMGIPHIRIPFQRLRSIPHAGRLLRRLLKQQPFDIIHAHARIPALIADSLAKKAGIPLIVTVHARFRVTPVLRRLSRWGNSSIAVSEDLRQYLRENYDIPLRNITVIPNGIECPPAPIVSACEDKLRLFFCSRLEADCSDAAQLLCRVAPRLKQEFPSLELWFVGGGQALPDLWREAEAVNRMSSDPFLFFTGRVESPSRLLVHAQAFVGVSRAALEAMAMGVPVILGGNEGFLGLLTPERLALAEQTNFCCRGCPPLREADFLSACRDLLARSATERAALGAQLSEYVRCRHSAETVAEAVEQVYRKNLKTNTVFRPGKLILCGYYGYGNAGDDALLFAAVQRAEQVYPSLPVTALTKRGKKDQPAFGICCICRSDPLAVARALRQADVLIFGGGTLFQDRTSFHSLLYYCALPLYAARHGTRTELWGNGLDELHSRLARRMVTYTLKQCSRLGLRDNRSFALAEHLLGNNAPIFKESDLAANLAPVDSEHITFLLKHYGVENVPFAVVIPKGNPCPSAMRVLLPWLAKLYAKGTVLLFIPLFPKEDERFCLYLARRLQGRLATRLTPAEVVGIMRCCQSVGSMRLHGLIFAECAHTDFTGFGNDPKLEQFCREHGGSFQQIDKK